MSKHTLELAAEALEAEAMLPKNKLYRKAWLAMAEHMRSPENIAAFDAHQELLALADEAARNQ